MFIETIQYSLQMIELLIKNYKDQQNVLPVTSVNDKVKCLDFDMDNVVLIKPQVKIVEVKQYNKSWLEVLDMV